MYKNNTPLVKLRQQINDPLVNKRLNIDPFQAYNLNDNELKVVRSMLGRHNNLLESHITTFGSDDTFPGSYDTYKMMMKRTGLTVRKVRDAVNKLLILKIITCINGFDHGMRTKNNLPVRGKLFKFIVNPYKPSKCQTNTYKKERIKLDITIKVIPRYFKTSLDLTYDKNITQLHLKEFDPSEIVAKAMNNFKISKRVAANAWRKFREHHTKLEHAIVVIERVFIGFVSGFINIRDKVKQFCKRNWQNIKAILIKKEEHEQRIRSYAGNQQYQIPERCTLLERLEAMPEQPTYYYIGR